MNYKGSILCALHLLLICLSGCAATYKVTFQNDSKSVSLPQVDQKSKPISFVVTDSREAKFKKILGKSAMVRIKNSQDISKIFQTAFEKEAERRSYTVTKGASRIVKIDVHEIVCTFMLADLYGLIKANISIVDDGSIIFQKSFISCVNGAEIGSGNSGFNLTANSVLSEFVQDVMSDNMVIENLR